MSKPLHSIIAILAVASAATLLPGTALAQGSAGGSIGKQGKSASGGEDAPAPRTTPRRAAAPSGNAAALATRSGCGNFFGIWTSGGGAWLYGKNDTVFNSNGTARHTSGIVGTWTCSGSEIVLIWKDWDNDRLVLSADGKRLDSSAGGRGFSR